MHSADLYIREQFEFIDKRNTISGHQWTEHGPTTTYMVISPTGILSRHRTQKSAEQALIEWREYYERGEWEFHPVHHYKKSNYGLC